MSLKDTFKQMRDLLIDITGDLEKSENGNKAASQRVRTGTVKLEKIAKLFRKESIAFEKKNKGVKKPAAKAAGPSKGKSRTAVKQKTTAARPKAASLKAKPRAKTTHASMRSATAKLPMRRVNAPV